MIQSVSEEAELLYVPYEHYNNALNAFSRDQRQVDRILTQVMPGLATMTRNYVSKLISFFLEFTYTRGQRIVTEGPNSQYIYYIA